MDFLNNVKDGLSSNLLGDIEKAVIKVIDMDSYKEMKDRGEENPLDPVDYKKPTPTGNGFKKNESLVPFKRRDHKVDFDGAPDLFGDQEVSDQYGLSEDKIKAKIFTVQFNPSELVISGQAGGYEPQTNFNEGSGKNYAGKTPLYMELNVKLVFDRVVPGDAFTGITSTSMSAAGQRGASLINKEKDSRERQKKSKVILDTHSVRGEVEALIGAVRKPGPQLVNFVWGDYVNYMGLINRIDCTYTMFNTNGEPIRAIVDLAIRVAEEKDEEVSYFTENQWYDKYNKAFGKNSSYVKGGQNIGSMIGWG